MQDFFHQQYVRPVTFFNHESLWSQLKQNGYLAMVISRGSYTQLCDGQISKSKRFFCNRKKSSASVSKVLWFSPPFASVFSPPPRVPLSTKSFILTNERLEPENHTQFEEGNHLNLPPSFWGSKCSFSVYRDQNPGFGWVLLGDERLPTYIMINS